MCRIAVFLSMPLLGLFAWTPPAAAQYSITALDVLPGGVDTAAFALNELGRSVGHSTLDRSGNVGRSRPVIWNLQGEPQELWPASDPIILGGIPLGINDFGQVVGRYGGGSGVPLPGPGVRPGRAFIWDPDQGLRDLGSLGGANVEAVAINNLGQVAGSSTLAGEGAHAFIWDPVQGMRSLGTLGGLESFATAINRQGQVAGTSSLADSTERPFLWDPVDGMRELESPSGGLARAIAINDLGHVLGIDFGTRLSPGAMVIWSANGNTIVPVESGASVIPFDITNHDTVVGAFIASGEAEPDAFIWNSEIGFTNLETLLPQGSRWDFEAAHAINERGDIVGVGRLDGRLRGFLMTPIPEPSTIVLAVVGVLYLALMSGRARRRRMS